MIYERGLEPGTLIENLRVDRIARGNPLIYAVTCLRPECGGTFQIDHERLTGLKMDWCGFPGCNQAAKERSLRGYRPQVMRIKQGFDTSRPLEGQESFNIKALSRVSELSTTRRYEVECMLCHCKWREAQSTLLAMTGYMCQHNALCRLEMERAVADRNKESNRRTAAALTYYGGGE